MIMSVSLRTEQPIRIQPLPPAFIKKAFNHPIPMAVRYLDQILTSHIHDELSRVSNVSIPDRVPDLRGG